MKVGAVLSTAPAAPRDRKSTRLNSSHRTISYISPPSLHDALPISVPRGVVVLEGHRGETVQRHFLRQDEVLRFGDLSARGVAEAAVPVGEEHFDRPHEGRGGAQHGPRGAPRSEEHTSELQSPYDLVHLPSFPTRRSSDLGSPRCRRTRRPSWRDSPAPLPPAGRGAAFRGPVRPRCS